MKGSFRRLSYKLSLLRKHSVQTPDKRANLLFWTIKHVQAGTLVIFPTKRILHLFCAWIPFPAPATKFRRSRGVTVREQLVNPWHTSTGSLDMG